MPGTWKALSKKHLGYVARQSKINEMYVATLEIEEWLKEGVSERVVFLRWNGGDGVEKSGVNQHGIAYNTALYADKAEEYYWSNESSYVGNFRDG